MKLSELVEFYRANGFVVVSAGNGCAEPQWCDYAEAVGIDAMIADVEMDSKLTAEECQEFDNAYQRALGSDMGVVTYTSEWLVLDGYEDGYKRWDGVDQSAYRWRIIF